MNRSCFSLFLLMLFWLAACQPTEVEPVSQTQSFGSLFVNGSDKAAVDAFLLHMRLSASARSTQEQVAYYNNLGVAADLTGNYTQAVAYHEQALALRSPLSDPTGMARSYNNLAIVYRLQGKQAEALTLYAQAVNLFDAHGQTRYSAYTLGNYAQALQTQGDLQAAREKYMAALHIWENLQDATQIAALQNALAMLSGNTAGRVTIDPPTQGDIIRFVEE